MGSYILRYKLKWEISASSLLKPLGSYTRVFTVFQSEA